MDSEDIFDEMMEARICNRDDKERIDSMPERLVVTYSDFGKRKVDID